MTEKRKITSATLVMAAATFMSRIAGLVRDVVIARFFGAGMVTDAFFMAFTIPNLLRRFFAEGSLTAAFVPIYTDVYQQDGEQRARQLANRCATLLLLVMLVIVTVGVLLSPWIVKGIGFGFYQVPGKLELTDQLNRIMFPYIALVSLLALLTGILNVRGHFFLPSLSPLFLNLTMIISAVTCGTLFDEPIFALAIGVVLGGIVQLLLQYPVIVKYRLFLRPDFNFLKDDMLRQIVRLMGPGVVGVAIYQINIVVTRLLASFLSDGSLSYLYYGQRLFEFPQGIFVVSLAQAILPTMSRQAAEDDMPGVQSSLSFAVTLVSVFMLPAIVGLIFCAEPIYSLFFYGGNFDLQALKGSTLALMCYAPGLIFVGYSSMSVRAFYALKDTRTPVVASFWTLIVNLVGGSILMQFFGFAGLAVALTLSSMFNAVILLILLQRRTGRFLNSALLSPLLRVLPACIAMGLFVSLVLQQVNWFAPGQVLSKSVCLTVAVVGGSGLYLAGCYLLRIDEVRRGISMLKSRGKVSSNG